jgi:hypothetical protein
MLQPGLEARAFPTTATKTQRETLTLLPPISQALFLLQHRSAEKSALIYGPRMLAGAGRNSI